MLIIELYNTNKLNSTIYLWHLSFSKNNWLIPILYLADHFLSDEHHPSPLLPRLADQDFDVVLKYWYEQNKAYMGQKLQNGGNFNIPLFFLLERQNWCRKGNEDIKV